ncbi:MAG: MATE family efflux transporter [Bilophila wadsworthia]
MKLNTERIHTIWHLTWPQCIMLLCQFVIGITDVWAGGRIGSEVQASIGLITQCHMMFMALAMAAVSGAVASISQSLGACKFVRARRYVGLVTIGCIAIGSAIAVAASVWREPLLRLIQTPESIMPVAIMFLTATIWGIPGQYTLTIGAAVFRSAKMVLIPLYVTGTACLLNVFGDLAFGLGWWGFPAYGATGIAYSTLVSVTVRGRAHAVPADAARAVHTRQLPRLALDQRGPRISSRLPGPRSARPSYGKPAIWSCTSSRPPCPSAGSTPLRG